MRPRVNRQYVAVALLVAATAGAAPPPNDVPPALAGTVRKVVDGDTLHLVDSDRHVHVIRLTDIDAPETSHGARRPGQAYGDEAAAFLRERSLGRQAQLRCFDADIRQRADGRRRERLVCRVTVDGVDLNRAIVDAGLAMVQRWNPRYVRDPQLYAREATAKAARIGLWADGTPIEPWVWRRACWEDGLCPARSQP